MAKEWILNQSMNRWGLNKKKSVGPVSELIRTCSPRTVDEWEKFYYEKVHAKTYLKELGKKLYIKITEVIQCEVEEVTEEDCINYMKTVIIDRTFQGYQTEIQTVYGQLQNILDVQIRPAPDEWDRLYNVDFFIQISNKFIGLQIKPITFKHTFEDYRWHEFQNKTHQKFQDKFGGKVFIVCSSKINNRKEIINKEVIDEIKAEIKRLKKF